MAVNNIMLLTHTVNGVRTPVYIGVKNIAYFKANGNLTEIHLIGGVGSPLFVNESAETVFFSANNTSGEPGEA